MPDAHIVSTVKDLPGYPPTIDQSIKALDRVNNKPIYILTIVWCCIAFNTAINFRFCGSYLQDQ
jgi:hypothetical protein